MHPVVVIFLSIDNRNGGRKVQRSISLLYWTGSHEFQRSNSLLFRSIDTLPSSQSLSNGTDDCAANSIHGTHHIGGNQRRKLICHFEITPSMSTDLQATATINVNRPTWIRATAINQKKNRSGSVNIDKCCCRSVLHELRCQSVAVVRFDRLYRRTNT